VLLQRLDVIGIFVILIYILYLKKIGMQFSGRVTAKRGVGGKCWCMWPKEETTSASSSHGGVLAERRRKPGDRPTSDWCQRRVHQMRK
jgi:hypothetical protein